MELIGELFAVLGPVLITAGLGYGWAKLDHKFDIDFVTSLVMHIGTPALILATFLETRPSFDSFMEMALATLAVFVLCAALAAIFLRSCGLAIRDYLPVATIPNSGNMGLPLCLFAFGEEGLALGIVFFTIASLLQFTIGISIVRGRFEILESLKMPLIYAVLIALVFVVGDIQAPRWLSNTLNLIGGLTIPLMILALGVSLARLEVRSFARSLLISLFRLAVGFAVGLVIAELWGREGGARGVLVLQSSLSPAVYNYLFAERFGRAGGEVAGVIVVSTLLAFLVLPFSLAYLI